MSCGRKLAKNHCTSCYEEESGNGLDTHSGDLMTMLPGKHYSGHHKATEEEGDPGTLGEGNVECTTSVAAGERWRQRLKTELNGVK